MFLEFLAAYGRNTVPPALALRLDPQALISFQTTLEDMPVIGNRIAVTTRIAGLKLLIEQIDRRTCSSQRIGQTATFTNTIGHGTLSQ